VITTRNHLNDQPEPGTGTTVTVDLAGTSVSLPLCQCSRQGRDRGVAELAAMVIA
jgi:hypothetical protein